MTTVTMTIDCGTLGENEIVFDVKYTPGTPDVMYLSNGDPGYVVFSPFAGIGSEGYCALQAGRKFLGAELKESYFKQACLNLSRAREAQGLLIGESVAEVHDKTQPTISGLENACRIGLSRIDALQAENRLLRECARTPDLERIDAAIDAARSKP